jgi:hypothetical protein
MSPPSHWWQHPFRTFQTNLREIDAGLDVNRVLDQIEALGANTWLLNTGGIVSFYPSQLPYQHPSPWLTARGSGDLVGDAVTAAHQRGIRVISRVDFSKVHADIADAHRDWCFTTPTGEHQIYNGLHSTCPSGPYYQQHSFDILKEILQRYPVDGFFFNWFSFNQRDYSGRQYGICQCANCQERFAALKGLPLPESEDWHNPAYAHWLDYTRETLDDIAGRIRVFIKDYNPEAALILRQNTDVAFQEVNNAVDRPQPLWVTWAGEAVRESRTARPDTPILVNSVMFLDLPYRFAPEQPGLLQLHLTQTIAQGGNPSAYMIGIPDLFGSHPIFDAIGDVLRFHRDNEPYYTYLRSAARVVVISSRRSREHYGADGEAKVTRELRGVYRALIEAHIPFDILPDDQIQRPQALARYDAVVLPNVAILDDEQSIALDRFVESGGGLVATYESSAVSSDGTKRPGLGLRSLGVRRALGRREAGEQTRSAYLQTAPNHAGPMPLIAIDRGFLDIEPEPDAEPALTLIPPSRYGPPEKCYWETETADPGLLRHQHGQGLTSYLPWPIGALYHDLSIPEHRALLADEVVRVSRSSRQIVTNAPAQVEVTIGQQPAGHRTLIHLINYSGHQGRAFHNPLQIRDIELTLTDTGPVTTATALRLGQKLPIQQADGHVTIALPALDAFEAIVLDGGTA